MTIISGATVQGDSPARYWYDKVTGITADARRILKAVDEAKRIYCGNNLTAVIAATVEGEPAAGTTRKA